MENLDRIQLNDRFIHVYGLLEEKGEIVKSSRSHSKAAFAEKLGTKGHIIDKYIRKERFITYPQAKKLCQLFNVNEAYMFQGNGDVFVSLFSIDTVANPANNIVYSNVAAFASSATVDSQPYEESTCFSIPGVTGYHAAFTINGDSMSPTISNGDLVICKPLEFKDQIHDNEIYAVITSENIVVKRIKRLKDSNGPSRFKLISDNYIEHDPFILEAHEIRKVMKVVHRITAV